MITPSFGLTATERVLPRMALDFTTASLDSRVTFTRTGNTATCVNNSGNVATVNANLPRFDFDPSTLACKGLLIEESRTNSCSNNTAQGAVAGTPGTIPTGWAVIDAGGLSREVVGTGTENGISYVDLRFFGTSVGTNVLFTWQQGGSVAATQNQNWSSSFYIKLVGGSLANLTTIRQLLIGTNAVGGTLSADGTVFTPTSSSLISQRINTSSLLFGALTAFVYPRFDLLFSAGVAINVTLRIGLPQLELGAFPTSVIPTSSGAVTRNADVATMTGTNFSDWYNAGAGGAVARVLPSTVSGTRPALQFDDATANEVIALRGNTTNPELVIVDGGSPQAQIDAGTITANTAYNLGVAWNTNNCAAAVNGGAAVTDTSATIPTVTQARLGSDGTNYLNGNIQTLRYWPQRITNAEVQAFSK